MMPNVVADATMEATLVVMEAPSHPVAVETAAVSIARAMVVACSDALTSWGTSMGRGAEMRGAKRVGQSE